MKAIIVSALVCPKCRMTLMSEGVEPDRTVHCPTKHCKNYNIRYREPTIELKPITEVRPAVDPRDRPPQVGRHNG